MVFFLCCCPSDCQVDDSPGNAPTTRANKGAAQLLPACGEHIDLTLDQALKFECVRDLKFLGNQVVHQFSNSVNLRRRPLSHALQSRYVDCGCSALGRLTLMGDFLCGSRAEDLTSLPGPSIPGADNMIELGPVRWSLPSAEGTSAEGTSAEGTSAEGTSAEGTSAEGTSAEGTSSEGTSAEGTSAEGTSAVADAKSSAEGKTAPTANLAGPESDPTPRLVIAETKNPGFVLVLQERRNDCPHQERKPLRADAVRRFMTEYQLLHHGEMFTHRGTHGPACSFFIRADKVMIYNEIPCLRVPVWCISKKFFTRQRKFDWPPEDVRENIRQFGLHLVPVGAPGSPTEKMEWYLSFVRAEAVISYLLTENQRCAIIAFKTCRAYLGDKGKVIKSYFVKTALLWLCEQTPAEDWTGVAQGVLKLLDYLDEAVRTGNLPCYFYSRLNLLRFVSQADREAMKRALGAIRRGLRPLLAQEVCSLFPALPLMLTREAGPLPERQLRLCLTRWRILFAVYEGLRRHLTVTADRQSKLLPVLLRSFTPAEVAGLFRWWSHQYPVQTGLYQALTVAPGDVASRVQLSTSGDGFVFDAAPLLKLLTDADLKLLLGDPDVLRAWLRRQHQLPEARRPAGLPADLRDLLLNIPLLDRAFKESAPREWAECFSAAAASAQLIPDHSVTPVQEACERAQFSLTVWREMAAEIQTTLRMDKQTALQTAKRTVEKTRQQWSRPETFAEFETIWRSLQDPWQLRPFAFRALNLAGV